MVTKKRMGAAVKRKKMAVAQPSLPTKYPDPPPAPKRRERKKS